MFRSTYEKRSWKVNTGVFIEETVIVQTMSESPPPSQSEKPWIGKIERLWGKENLEVLQRLM